MLSDSRRLANPQSNPQSPIFQSRGGGADPVRDIVPSQRDSRPPWAETDVATQAKSVPNPVTCCPASRPPTRSATHRSSCAGSRFRLPVYRCSPHRRISPPQHLYRLTVFSMNQSRCVLRRAWFQPKSLRRCPRRFRLDRRQGRRTGHRYCLLFSALGSYYSTRCA